MVNVAVLIHAQNRLMRIASRDSSAAIYLLSVAAAKWLEESN